MKPNVSYFDSIFLSFQKSEGQWISSDDQIST